MAAPDAAPTPAPVTVPQAAAMRANIDSPTTGTIRRIFMAHPSFGFITHAPIPCAPVRALRPETTRATFRPWARAAGREAGSPDRYGSGESAVLLADPPHRDRIARLQVLEFLGLSLELGVVRHLGAHDPRLALERGLDDDGLGSFRDGHHRAAGGLKLAFPGGQPRRGLQGQPR